jgi:UDP-N-acetylglucosamine 2-epimerase (non-hydrolysing)
MKPLVVASTRPELVKLAPLLKEFEGRGIGYVFATTGQHYDAGLYETFLEDLDLRPPDRDIEVGSGEHGDQTARALQGLERFFSEEKPDVVVVEGDTNSVLSASLAAAKLRIPLAHVEAGLRSHDRRMPEEINRIVADHCSQVLFAPTEEAGLNLIREGIPPERIHIVGNTIVDAVRRYGEKAEERRNALLEKIPEGLPREYLVLTLHRSETVDEEGPLRGIMEALLDLGDPVFFPLHPRTRERLRSFGLLERLGEGNLRLLPPLGYLEFLLLMKGAKAVLTDSGGIQEEAITLGVPCLTLRKNTERPESVRAGGNLLVGVGGGETRERIRSVLEDKDGLKRMGRARNPFGDGKSAPRIAETLLRLHREGALQIPASDFLRGFPRRELVRAEVAWVGKKLSDLPLHPLRVFRRGKEAFPFPDLRVEEGDLLEILRP